MPRPMPNVRMATTATARSSTGGCCAAREISQAETAISPTLLATAAAPATTDSAKRPSCGRASRSSRHITPTPRRRPRRGVGVMWRLLRLARPQLGRLALSVVAGAAAVASSVGLMAVSAWLISRAAQHPPVLDLAVAVVAIRTFGIGRGIFRYAERLISHDAAFRVLADLRVRVYTRLEPLAPAGLADFRSGDLLSRLVADVDALQDLFLRVLPPPLIAAIVGGSAVVLAWALLPGAGAVLAATLLLAGVAVPALTTRSGRRASARVAAARGELSMHVVDLLHGAPELLAYGAADTQLDRVARSDAELTGLSRSTALTTGLGAGLGSVAAGLALWGTLRVAVPAVSAGSLDGVWLAVLVLTALAVFEVVAPLPVAAQQLERVRRAAGRVFGVLDAPAPVNDPARPRPVPAGTPVVTLEAARLRYASDAACRRARAG